MRTIIYLLISILFISATTKRPKYKTVVYDLKYIEKNLIYIPKGSFVIGISDQDVPIPVERRARVVSIPDFYMFNEEVSNGFYVSYLHEKRKSMDSSSYAQLLPDTLVWREPLAYNEPYVEYYLRHPAYSQYPLVGVSYDQCLMFCEWLTNKYNNSPDRKFKKVKFSLPDSVQFEYAARGGLDNSPFPWAGPSMQNKTGQWLANFKIIDQSSIHRREFEETNIYGTKVNNQYLIAGNVNYNGGYAGQLNDHADITAPCRSYWPNKYGLYNMSGNVEEFISSKGKTMGGSWRDPGYYLQNGVYETYEISKSTSSERGFRFIMTVLEQ